MDMVRRVQAILLRPKDEWAKIKGETTSVAKLFTSYAMVLAAVPAAAKFVGRLLFRSEIPFKGVPAWSVGRSLSNAVLSYLFSLAIVYLAGLIIDALAPNFSSKRSLTNAMKLAVYSMTPFWAAGVLYIVPGLDVLVTLAGLYGLYLLYEGFHTPMMETPKDRTLGFVVVSVLAVAALFLVVSLIFILFSIWGVA